MSVNYQPRIICVEAIVDLDLIVNGAFDRVQNFVIWLFDEDEFDKDCVEV